MEISNGDDEDESLLVDFQRYPDMAELAEAFHSKPSSNDRPASKAPESSYKPVKSFSEMSNQSNEMYQSSLTNRSSNSSFNSIGTNTDSVAEISGTSAKDLSSLGRPEASIINNRPSINPSQTANQIFQDLLSPNERDPANQANANTDNDPDFAYHRAQARNLITNLLNRSERGTSNADARISAGASPEIVSVWNWINSQNLSSPRASQDDNNNSQTNATNTPGAPTNPNDQELPNNIQNMSSSLKMALPFVLILIIKVFMDHILHILTIFFAYYCLHRIKASLEEQISLKSRCNPKVLFAIIAFGFITLVQITVMIYSLTRELIWYRLGFIVTSAAIDKEPISLDSKANSSPSFTSTILLVCTIDITAVILLCMIKAVDCLLIQSSYRVKREYIAQYCQHELVRNAGNRNANNSSDIERGITSSRRSTATESGHSSESNFSGVFLDLVRRRGGDSNSNSMSGASTNPRSVSTTSQAFVNTSNSSDVSMHNEESSRYLFILRILTGLDAVGNIYRSIIPIPVWLAYYSSVVQIAGRLKDCIEVFKALHKGNSQYGYYVEDQRRCSGECPVCFDSLTMDCRPISLDCRHTFCEVCILEWLNKEKTCPVCRHEVKSETPAIDEIRSLSNQSLPFMF